MASINELHDEHNEVRKRLQALENEVGTLVFGQVLEGTELIVHFPDFIQKAILPHFLLEEKVIFPLLKQRSAEEQKLGDELVAEHLQLKEWFFTYLMELRSGQVTPNLVSLSQRICHHLAAHAAKEDSVLLPALRQWLHMPNSVVLGGHAPPVMFENNTARGDTQDGR